MSSVGNNAIQQFRALIKRIQLIEEDIASLNTDKKEIYAEAKGCGFDKKILRKVVIRLSRERSDVLEEDEMIEMYEGMIRSMNAIDREKDPLDL